MTKSFHNCPDCIKAQLICKHRTNGLLCPKCRYNPKTYLDQKR